MPLVARTNIKELFRPQTDGIYARESIAEMDLTDFDSDDVDDSSSSARTQHGRVTASTDKTVSCPGATDTDYTPHPSADADDWDGQPRALVPTWTDTAPSDTPVGPQTHDGTQIAWVADLPDTDKPTHQGSGDFWEPLIEPFHGASIVRPDRSLSEIKPENGTAIPADAIAYVVAGKHAYQQTISSTRVTVPESFSALSDMKPAVTVQTLRSPQRAFGIGGTRCEQLIRLLNGSGRFKSGSVSIHECGRYPSIISLGGETVLFTPEPVQPPTQLSPPDWTLATGSVTVTVPEATTAGRRALTRLQSGFATLDCQLIRYDGPGHDGHRFGIDPVTAGLMSDSDSSVPAKTGPLCEPSVTACDITGDTGKSGQTADELAETDDYAQISISAESICRAGTGHGQTAQLHTALDSRPNISDQHCARLPDPPYEPGDTIPTKEATTGERNPVVLSIDYSPPAPETAAITSRAYGQYEYQLLVDNPGYSGCTHKVLSDSVPVTMWTPDGVTRVPTDLPPANGTANSTRQSDPTQFTSRL